MTRSQATPMSSQIVCLEGMVARLKEERNAALTREADMASKLLNWNNPIPAMLREINALRKKNKALREVLEPFTSKDIVDETSGTIPFIEAACAVLGKR